MVPLIALMLGATAVAQPIAPSQITIASDASCPSCRIVLDSVILSDSSTDGHFSESASFSEGRRGDIYVVSGVEPARILHFSAQGEFTGSFGRLGEGPGEYGIAVPPVVSIGDSLNVFDVRRRRWTVLSPSGSHVRTMPIPLMPTPLTPLPDGRFVLNGNPGTREAAGYPLHLFDRDGALLTSFGTDAPALRPDLGYLARRRLAVGPEGTIWSAPINSYRVEEWTPDGELRTRVDIDAPWFEPWVTRLTRPDSIRPQPSIIKIWWSDDRLWIATHVADAAWKPQSKPGHGREGPSYSVEDRDRMFDTRIEVFDIANRRMLATAIVDSYLTPSVYGTFMAHYGEDKGLKPLYTIYRFALQTSN
jgi:hypothetical protein